MGKVIVSEFVSLDGIMEDPGGAEGTPHGGWTIPYWNDEIGAFKKEELFVAEAMLLGRVTYEGFAAAWPAMSDPEGFANRMNSLPKYVVTSKLEALAWNSTRLEGDVAPAVRALKDRVGGGILVAGSATLVHDLTDHGLVDEYRLVVYPVVLGGGKRLFDNGAYAKLDLTYEQRTGTGAVLAVVSHGIRGLTGHAPGETGHSGEGWLLATVRSPALPSHPRTDVAQRHRIRTGAHRWSSPCLSSLPSRVRVLNRRCTTPPCAKPGWPHEIGFDGLWVAEHHFDSDFSVSPSPNLLLAAASQVTEHLTLGCGINVLPFHRPTRLAEEGAMLDVLSKGRFQWGIGRGITGHEFASFGIDAAQSRQIFNETHDAVIGAWSTGRMDYHGAFVDVTDTEIAPQRRSDPAPAGLGDRPEPGVGHLGRAP